MRKKKKSVKSKYEKTFIMFIIITLCLIIIGGYFLITQIGGLKEYKIQSRVNQVKEYSLKDDGYKTVGWLRVQGTNIDYPVLYGPGYDFGMKTDDFVWTEVDFEKLNNIVYITGHNFLNLSKKPLIANENHKRFEQLMSFAYLDFVKKNKYIQYTINGHDYLYKIFAVSFTKSTELDIYNYTSFNKKKMKKYLDRCLDESMYDFDVDVNTDDKVISLITCTRMFDYSEEGEKEFKVDARLVRDGENLDNYDVKENDNYKEVKKIMESEEND